MYCLFLKNFLSYISQGLLENTSSESLIQLSNVPNAHLQLKKKKTTSTFILYNISEYRNASVYTTGFECIDVIFFYQKQEKTRPRSVMTFSASRCLSLTIKTIEKMDRITVLQSNIQGMKDENTKCRQKTNTFNT